MAGDGPMPIIDGSTPTVAYATSLASGLNPFFFTDSSLANTIAPAPSQIPCQFKFLVHLHLIIIPIVGTRPFGLKAIPQKLTWVNYNWLIKPASGIGDSAKGYVHRN